MRRTVQLLVLLLWSYFVPAGQAFALPNHAIGNVSEAWDTDNVLRLVFGKASNIRCFLIVIRDGYLPDTYFSQVSGSEGEGHDDFAAVVFKVPTSTGNVHLAESHITKVVKQARRLRQSSWCVTVVVLSDDPIFLGAFAEASDKGRMLVWKTRLIVVTRVTMPQLQTLLQDYWTYSMMNTMFITQEEKSVYRWQGYVHIPYSPTGAQVKRVGNWRQINSILLADGQKLFPEKYSNFNGMDVNMTWFPLPPYWMPNNGSASKNYTGSTFSGRDVTIIETIAGALNFSIHLVPYRGTENWMLPLRSREALVRPIILPIMPHMLEEFEITFFVEPSTLAFTMAKPVLKPNWQSLFYPLQTDVWGYVAATVIVVFMVLLLMKSEGENKSQGPWQVMKQVFGTLLDEAIHGELPRRSSTRLVLTAWMIFAFIVGTVYRSNLTACLTVPTYPTRAENLADLFHMGVKITMLPEMVMFYKSFKESGSEVLETLADSMAYVPTSVEGLHQAITKNKAYLYERLHMELKVAEHFTKKDGSTPLYVTQRNFMSGYSTFILVRNTPFKASLDHFILAFHEAGLIRKWTTDVMAMKKREIKKRKKSEINEKQEERKKGTLALTLIHMQGPFFLYLAGIILSFLAFLFETVLVFSNRNLFTNNYK
ncbi:ionotropic receptor 21a-like [Scylla paramamosain]|uniref:ionotropic receptor 21a-like n=1 Tax=Scylla paramamosain TaxID=85552 RepID=UPI0030837DB7